MSDGQGKPVKTIAETSPKDGPVDPDLEFDNLLRDLNQYLPGFNRDQIQRAYRFGAECHSDQTRKSGEPYITHPLAVARIVASLKLDQASIVAAILHDTVEDTPCTVEEIEKVFGREVAHLVDGLTKIAKIKFRSSQERLAENFRKMIMAMAKDLRVILIKLCDRLHNMRTMGSMAPEKSRKISQETLEIYAPLAGRLGIYNVKSELEDLCLRYLKNDVYQDIRLKISAKKSQRQAHIEEVKQILENELKKYGFKEIEVYGRPKHFFSIYKKMVERHTEFEDIHDLFAFRIIVPSIKDCYEALGVVHAMWKPMPGRFKDYIAMPKANMYQSLHTTVIRPNGEPAEIQIRTREMHETCEFGVAAHWAYKEGGNTEEMKAADLQKFTWLRQIVQWQTELKDPNEFMEALKVDLFDEEIFVFTPKGDVFSLPNKATALDFAFAVHTELGLKTMGVKVNGRMVPIKKQLNSGDIVEIITSPHQHPTKDWLNFAVTSKARSKIRTFLRQAEREHSRRIGREILNQALAKRELSLEALEKAGKRDKLLQAAHQQSVDEVLVAIGYGRLNVNDLIGRLFPEQHKQETLEEQLANEELPGVFEALKTTLNRKAKGGILVSGYGDVMVQYARCCNPIPGEEIIGYISRGRGVLVHRSNCPRAMDLDPARKVDVEWSERPSDIESYRCFLSILTQDKPGVLAEVTNAISASQANVFKAEVKVSAELTGVLDFELGVRNINHLNSVVNRIEAIPTVISVKRKNMSIKPAKRTRKRGLHR